MTEYEEVLEPIKKLLDVSKYVVLSTADKKGVVSASTMCMVADGLKVYFQTDKSFEKTKNIRENQNVAITIGNTYFKGKAKVVGRPLGNKKFVELMKQKHFETFENYSLLPNQVLILVKLTEVKTWKISDGVELITKLDFRGHSVSKIKCDNLKGGF